MTDTTRQLIADLKVLAADSEELARATATQAGERVTELRGKIQRCVAEIKPRLAQVESGLKGKVADAASRTDSYVRNEPWTAIGVAAGIALVVGILIGRR